MPVSFRLMRAEDKELFTNLLRSLPRKDNYYLLVDVHNDRTIQRWMDGVESGEIISVVALEGGQMVGYCNLRINDPPWTRHVGEIRMSVTAAYRGNGIGRILAGKIFSIARARGIQKIWVRMAVSQKAAQVVFQNLGFRSEALLSGFVKNENGSTESLVIMSHDFGVLWQSKRRPVVSAQRGIERGGPVLKL
jgi:ribosomal protein S18 acetylase RimI-like enzyme